MTLQLPTTLTIRLTHADVDRLDQIARARQLAERRPTKRSRIARELLRFAISGALAQLRDHDLDAAPPTPTPPRRPSTAARRKPRPPKAATS